MQLLNKPINTIGKDFEGEGPTLTQYDFFVICDVYESVLYFY